MRRFFMFESVAWASIGIASVCAVWIAIDEMRRPQTMWIMNLVWPLTALYLSVFALWAYVRLGRARLRTEQRAAHHGHTETRQHGHGGKQITAAQVAVATSHCGAGCVLADLLAEFGIATAGITLFGLTLWASYVIDFAAAWTLGIAFQYFSIKPMSDLSPAEALVAAIKADTLSILAFQAGMYAWMAVVFFVLFPEPHLTPFQPAFWLMMQVAMIFGYATAFPMNRWLVLRGWKEAM
jgi:hypothetical protein